MEQKKYKSFFKPYLPNYMFMLDDFRGLQSIAQEDMRSFSINKLLDQESEKKTISTNKTKSSNFSQDSIMKSLMQMSQITTNHMKDIKDSLRQQKPRSLNQIIGNDYAKNVVQEFFQSKFLKGNYNICQRTWRLLLFYGPPGVGKTELTHTIAYQSKRTVFWVSISNLISRFMGESEKMIEILFELAKEYSPSLVVMEEVDSIGRKRSSKENDAERRLKIEFLKQLDTVADCDEDIAFIGTTNLPWELDVAFLRRFERKVFMPILNKLERIKFLKNSFQDSLKINQEEYDKLGSYTKGMSGAELLNFIRSVMIQQNMSPLEDIDLNAMKRLLQNHPPGISKSMMNNYIKFVEKYGEGLQIETIEKDLYRDENLDYIIIIMIQFVLLVNKLGQTRIAQYFENLPQNEKKTLEAELVRKCLSRNPQKSFVIEHLEYKVIFRRYASLYFIFGVDKSEENPMSYYILIHRFVQILDSYFGNVCELDIMFNLDKVYYILEEMIQNGDLVDCNENSILGPLKVLDNVNQLLKIS